MKEEYGREELEEMDTNELRRLIAMGFRGEMYRLILDVYNERVRASTCVERGFK